MFAIYESYNMISMVKKQVKDRETYFEGEMTTCSWANGKQRGFGYGEDGESLAFKAQGINE
jgi:hypothetical protein